MSLRATSILYDRDDPMNGIRTPLTRLGAPLLYAYDASTFFKRLRGLHAFPPLGISDALVIRPCRCIHTYGMKYTIDVVFLDQLGDIKKVSTVCPSQSAWCFSACIAVEMAEGTAQRLDLQVGQRLLPISGRWS